MKSGSEHAAMTKSFPKFVPIFTVIALQVAVAPVFHAQSLGALTHVTPVPDGANFYVDGQSYFHDAAAVWPAGSKHILYVDATVQQLPSSKTQLIFKSWNINGTALPLNPVAVTGDPAVAQYQAVFGVAYALSVVFFDCPDPAHCASPGTIYVNGAAVVSTQDIYIGAGGTAVLQAIPNPGYVFAGWQQGAGQVITGLQNTVTLNAPVQVYPKFQVARKINLATVPPNLLVLADRILVPTPNSVDWGWDTVHSVGPVSPQQDIQGKWWSFSSWSDGGAANHAYTVADFNYPDTLTATYVPSAFVTLRTSPIGLTIKIDGRDNLLQPYNMNWGDGEVHHLEAPAQQTDAQGRIWAFSSWSNGAPAVQDFTVPPTADTTGVLLTATYNQLGKATVTSSLSGLSVTLDGTACTTPCDVVRPLGTVVHVTAPASVPQGDGSRADFTGWTGQGAGDLALTLGTTAQTVSANYHFMNRFSAASNPPNGATWNIQPASQDGFYDAQSTVAVSLTALPGYRFRRWDGDLSGTIPSGAVTMTAPRNVNALLDVIPYIAPTGMANGAGTTPQAGVAPGSVASIFGANLAASVVVAPDGVLPQTLGGVTVMAGTRILPLFFVSPNQINVQLPDDLAPGTQSLIVSSQGQPDVHATFTVVRDAPGLFPQVINGQAFAVALHEDGTQVTTDSPARHGELLTVYGTGMGPADHVRPEGFAVPQTPPYMLADSISVQVGNDAIAAENAFAAPGRVGIDAVQFRLDDSAPNGTSATLHITINGQDSNTVLIPIQ
jgi:uncharacterized protein (TIGR03437 family)